MTNEQWQSLSQIVGGIGTAVAALSAFGFYHLSALANGERGRLSRPGQRQAANRKLLAKRRQERERVCQLLMLVGVLITVLGGYGSWLFGSRVEAEKERTSAFVGQLNAKTKLVLSGTHGIVPRIELGQSNAFVVGAPSSAPNYGMLMPLLEESGLTVYKEDGEVKVSVTIRDKQGSAIAMLEKNEWKVNPSKSFDRNYTSDMLEVCDAANEPVLQVHVLPDRVRLQMQTYNSRGKLMGIGAVKLNLRGGNRLYGFITPDVRRDYSDIHFRRVFRYPSEKHLGELVSQTTLRPGK